VSWAAAWRAQSPAGGSCSFTTCDGTSRARRPMSWARLPAGTLMISPDLPGDADVHHHQPAVCTSLPPTSPALRSANTTRGRHDYQLGQYDDDLSRVPTQWRPLHRRRGSSSRRHSQPVPPRRGTDRFCSGLGIPMRPSHGRIAGYAVPAPGGLEPARRHIAVLEWTMRPPGQHQASNGADDVATIGGAERLLRSGPP
jgi:hypothetical protein